MRLQLHILSRGSSGFAPQGIIGTMTSIFTNEGPFALWKGTSAALVRSMTYGGLRFGLYKPIKALFTSPGDKGHPSVYKKLAAALSSGGLASFATNPVELIKVRLQASTDSASSQARPHMLSVFKTVLKARGVRGLWAGSLPSISRGATLTASQCVTYDEANNVIAQQLGLTKASFAVHFLASITSGLVSTTVTNPFDVVKTYMFVNRGVSVVDCVRDIFRQEGPRAFFKGWAASYIRLGPQTTLIFLFSEHIRKMMHMEEMAA